MFFNNKISFLSLLIYLIPASLIVGILVTEILIFTIFIFFIYYCIVNKNFSYFKSNYFKSFMIIYLFLILNSIFSEDIFLSLKVAIPYIRYEFCLIIWLALEENKNFLKHFRYFLVLPIGLLIFDGFIQYLFGYNIVGYSTQSSRLSSFFR